MSKRMIPGMSSIGVLVVLCLLTCFPFYMLLITSFKHRAQMIQDFWGIALPIHLDNYVDAYLQIWPFIINSSIITGGIVIGVLFTASFAAYSFSRFQFPGKELLFYLIIIVLMVPGFLNLIPQFLLVKSMGLLNTYAGQMLPPMAAGASMATLLMREFFSGVPKPLLEAAEIEGAGEMRIFCRIVIPLSIPIIATVAILNALHGWNNFIWPLVIVSGDAVKPVIIAIRGIRGTMQQGQGIQLAGYVIASVPLLFLFAIATKSFISGLSSGAVKG